VEADPTELADGPAPEGPAGPEDDPVEVDPVEESQSDPPAEGEADTDEAR